MILALVEFLAAHGGMLLAGTTVLLAAGAVAVALARAPLLQQRIAELTVLSTLLWLGLAAVPLPRLAWPASGGAEPAPAVAGKAIDAEPAQQLARAPSPVAAVPRDSAPAGDRERAAPSVDERADESAEASPGDVGSRSVVPLPDAPGPDVAPLRLAVPASPEVVPAATGLSFRWPRLLAMIALGASAVACAWLLVGVARVTRILAVASPTPARVTDLARELHDADSLPRLDIRMSRLARGPFCLGLPRPTVVLPSALGRSGQEEQLRAVLAHELAHLHRGDAFGHALFALALPVLALHPLFWWLSRRARMAAELMADDAAAARVGKSPYVRAFIDLAARQAPASHLLVGVSAFRSPSEFYRRMHMLLERRDRLTSRLTWGHRALNGALATLLVAGSAAFLGLRTLPAQDRNDGQNDARKEFALLREERDKLRAEIQEIRRLLQDLAPDKKPAANDGVSGATPRGTSFDVFKDRFDADASGAPRPRAKRDPLGADRFPEGQRAPDQNPIMEILRLQKAQANQDPFRADKAPEGQPAPEQNPLMEILRRQPPQQKEDADVQVEAQEGQAGGLTWGRALDTNKGVSGNLAYKKKRNLDAAPPPGGWQPAERKDVTDVETDQEGRVTRTWRREPEAIDAEAPVPAQGKFFPGNAPGARPGWRNGNPGGNFTGAEAPDQAPDQEADRVKDAMRARIDDYMKRAKASQQAAQPGAEERRDYADAFQERGQHQPRPDTTQTRDDHYVLDLLTRAIDLDTEIKLLQHRLARQTALQKSSLIAEEEVMQTKANLEGSTRKRDLVGRMLVAEREATERELAVVADQIKQNPNHAEFQIRMVRIQARLQMLITSATTK